MYEYHVMPAPKRGKKARGIKGAEGRFAHAIQSLLNEAAAEGWEYLRTDTLPSEERSGFTGRTTVYQNMLVFRREAVVAEPVQEVSETYEDVAVAAPAVAAVASEAVVEEVAHAQEHYAPELPSADDANAHADYAPRVERHEQ